METTKNVFVIDATSGKAIIGRSAIMQPKATFKSGSVKWFDDSRLIRKPVSISR